MRFVKRDFDCIHPKGTCHQGTRKKESKRKALKFLKMMIVSISRQVDALFPRSILSNLKHFDLRIEKSIIRILHEYELDMTN